MQGGKHCHRTKVQQPLLLSVVHLPPTLTTPLTCARLEACAHHSGLHTTPPSFRVGHNSALHINWGPRPDDGFRVFGMHVLVDDSIFCCRNCAHNSSSKEFADRSEAVLTSGQGRLEQIMLLSAFHLLSTNCSDGVIAGFADRTVDLIIVGCADTRLV